jgi:LmbE family N-acetylglucosaminyl deacetylase
MTRKGSIILCSDKKWNIMKKTIAETFLAILIVLSSIHGASGQQSLQLKNTSELQISLEKLNVLGSVLYIGAHPDDENTGLIAYWAKGKKYRSAYLSLTRGDGGQNLIGPEKGSEIGLIRTQELLQARAIDGGEQYFTRAVDFGFSKSPEESLEIWGKEDVLSDVVWVIRKFKPDVIVTRFPPGGNGGHGHHTASASLAKEAFSAAADPNRFPEQLKYVDIWQAKRLFWNNFRPGPDDIKNSISVDAGEYNPLLGKSYTEIAAESRSMHKSQGFGVSAYRGSRTEYFQLVSGESAKKDLFEGINTSWNRLNGGNKIGRKIEAALGEFNPLNPSAILNSLVGIYGDLKKMGDNYWVDLKKKELLEIIKSCAGLWIEAIASDYSAVPGDSVSVKISIVNRSPAPLKAVKVEFPSVVADKVLNAGLETNIPFSADIKILLPAAYPVSQPYWLSGEPSKGLFHVDDPEMIGSAENPPSVQVQVELICNGENLIFTVPLLYRWNDRVEGELYRPFEVRPPVTTEAAEKVEVFPDMNSKTIRVKLKNNCSGTAGEVSIRSADGWKIEPASIPFSFKNKYDERTADFTVTPPSNGSSEKLKIEVGVKGKIYDRSMIEIAHPHIKRLVYFPPSTVNMVKVDLKKYNEKIGYIMGSGDEIPECLEGIGYSVSLLNDKTLDEGNLSEYPVIIAGIRAYNTRDRLKYDQPRLLDYVKNGGTLIVQYNVPFGLQTEAIGPFPFKLSNDRITVEESPVVFINPAHRLLNFPNKITQEDFNGWIQERGLYFASSWDNKYETVLSGHDPGEKDLPGGTLFASYGKGVFIFSGYAWFRQLPEGIPGAYKLFVNMISASRYDQH